MFLRAAVQKIRPEFSGLIFMEFFIKIQNSFMLL